MSSFWPIMPIFLIFGLILARPLPRAHSHIITKRNDVVSPVYKKISMHKVFLLSNISQVIFAEDMLRNSGCKSNFSQFSLSNMFVANIATLAVI